MKKTYKNYTIDKSDVNSSWWTVRQDGNLIARTPTEEEARRVIWLNSGKGEMITAEMMS